MREIPVSRSLQFPTQVSILFSHSCDKKHVIPLRSSQRRKASPVVSWLNIDELWRVFHCQSPTSPTINWPTFRLVHLLHRSGFKLWSLKVSKYEVVCRVYKKVSSGWISDMTLTVFGNDQPFVHSINWLRFQSVFPFQPQSSIKRSGARITGPALCQAPCCIFQYFPGIWHLCQTEAHPCCCKRLSSRLTSGTSQDRAGRI